MRTTVTLVIALIIAANARATEPQLSAVQSLAWLAGCWAAEAGEQGSVEHWLAPAGGTMLGVGRTVKNGKTVESEFMRIQVNAEGKLVYIALPSGQAEAAFTQKEIAPNAVTFENLQHDFPQRISYRLLATDQLLARIEGLRKGVLRAIDYPMKRTRCDS
jgi:Domain of unknown function (DUF6265)